MAGPGPGAVGLVKEAWEKGISGAGGLGEGRGEGGGWHVCC